jgi:hypothetical protein
MSKRSDQWGMSFLSMIGIMIILACNAITSPVASPPTTYPTGEKIESTPTGKPTAITQPTLVPTKILMPLPTYTEVPVFPTNSGSEIGDIADACTLVHPEEVAVLFPNPPLPENELKVEKGYTVSRCTYNSPDMSLSISSAASPDFISSLDEGIQTIKQYPLYKQFSAFGAEIYQVGAAEDNPPRDVFAGILIKDNTAIQVVGRGKSYIYHAERETLLLKAIASRIPPEKTIFNACDLITIDEVEIRFSNPPAPTHELSRREGYSYASCTFQNENMKLTLTIGAEPGAAEGLTQNMQELMNQTGFIIRYEASGVDIYQWGGPNDETRIGELFMAYLIKGDNIMEIIGQGVSYKYDESREMAWITTIAGRIP